MAQSPTTIEVALSSELKIDGALTAEVVKPWVSALPGKAVISPKMRQVGNQLDPYEVCVGLKATWTEQRGVGYVDGPVPR